MKKIIYGLSIFLTSLPILAATPINLSTQPATFLSSFASSNTTFKETTRVTDFKKTLHVRIKQLYRGYPVWGGDGIVHIANGKMDGTAYQGLEQDLMNTPTSVLSTVALEKAIHAQASQYKTSNPKGEIIVYIDNNHKAHYAYFIHFYVPGNHLQLPAIPTMIVDAMDTSIVYKKWNNLQTLEAVTAGGFGGNHKTGQKIFDGNRTNLPALEVDRDNTTGICYMQNSHFVIKDYRNDNTTLTFPCSAKDPAHNNVYWNGNHDQVRTTWSPSNDVMFGIVVTEKLFKDWYNTKLLADQQGNPLFLPVTVHDPVENAYWDEDNNVAVFGDSDGSRTFNPFTQLDTVGHEMSHGFTVANSNLTYDGQSGGIDEAFSDMVGIADEAYIYGSTKFQVGLGDVKAAGKQLRYMDTPSKDCNGHMPGDNCSINDATQYHAGLDVHYSSGVFNRLFYILANTSFTVQHALDVMVQANMAYWKPGSDFADAACGVLKATMDYGYDPGAVLSALDKVKIVVPKDCQWH